MSEARLARARRSLPEGYQFPTPAPVIEQDAYPIGTTVTIRLPERFKARPAAPSLPCQPSHDPT